MKVPSKGLVVHTFQRKSHLLSKMRTNQVHLYTSIMSSKAPLHRRAFLPVCKLGLRLIGGVVPSVSGCLLLVRRVDLDPRRILRNA